MKKGNKWGKRAAVCMISGMLALTPPVLFSQTDPLVSEAHSGRTDSNSGHKDNKNVSGLGSYHYHCGGHPAHLHEGGICPYSAEASAQEVSDSSGLTGENADLEESSSKGSGAGESGAGSSSPGVTDLTGKQLTLSDGSEVPISEDLIRIAQDVLNQKGYDCGKADGKPGEKTKEALKACLEEEKEEGTDHLILQMVADALL